MAGVINSVCRLLLTACVLALLSIGFGPSTTTAASASFNYDAPTSARVDIYEVGGTEAGSALLNDGRDESASPAVHGWGTSTTPRREVLPQTLSSIA